MKHARKDYDRIQDPALENPELLAPGCSPIGADEPVFLLRAKDKHFVPMLEHYLSLVIADIDNDEENPDTRLTNSVARHIGRAVVWQRFNRIKSPDMPPEKESS